MIEVRIDLSEFISISNSKGYFFEKAFTIIKHFSKTSYFILVRSKIFYVYKIDFIFFNYNFLHINFRKFT